MPAPRIPDAVRRLFTETFNARDVAEPLASFDAGAKAGAVREVMSTRDFDVAGVRSDGLVEGYVERGSLGEGPCGQYMRPLGEAVVPDAAPLLAVLLKLNDAPFLFVRVLGAVGGIVTRAD